MKEYRVSSKKHNKRFSISKTDRKDRIIELLKNVWRVRHWFKSNFGKEITIINGYQMPLHRNESASQKTLSFTGETTYVKENYMLSRESSILKYLPIKPTHFLTLNLYLKEKEREQN